MNPLPDEPLDWSDQSTLLICIGAGVLIVNVVGWLLLFTLRSGGHSTHSTESLGRMLRGSLAEALGVFALVFVGALVCVAGPLAGDPAPGLLAVALAHGLTITALMAALGPTSGGHFNPAVTLGLVLAGRFRLGQAACWILGQ